VILPLYNIWDVSSFLVESADFSFRWYSLLFGLAFFQGCVLFFWFFKKEKAPSNELVPMLLTILVSGLIGSRLFHVYFYDWAYFSQNLWQIPMIWNGGLASHGAAFGMIAGILIYSRFIGTIYYWWIFDRLTVALPLGGAFVRFGNLMNSELPGIATDVSWAFIFLSIDNLPRHPVQLYEVIWSLLLFVLLIFFYKRPQVRIRFGLLSGVGLSYISLARFLTDFVKEGEVLLMGLKMGQLFSLPFLVLGIGIIWWGWKN